MSKHTRGPWTIEQTDPYGWRILGRQGIRASPEICHLAGFGAEADVRLIAAAPDLLEALKHAQAWASSGRPIHKGLLGVISAAIAKAEGDS